MLKRISKYPILVPYDEWCKDGILNPGVIVDGNTVHMLARGIKKVDGKAYSMILHLSSGDGIVFDDSGNKKPILHPECLTYECDYGFGFEDPRITHDSKYHVLVTMFGGRFKEDWRIAHLAGDSLFKLTYRDSPLTYGFKNGALYRDGIYFRGPSGVLYYGTGNRYEHWEVVMRPGVLPWCTKRVGIGPPPISVGEYDILIFHGVDEHNVYRLGIGIVLSPTTIMLFPYPVLSPELEWEHVGNVDNVVYSCGACVLGEDLFVYYGAADRVIGLAYVEIKSILQKWHQESDNFVLSCRRGGK